MRLFLPLATLVFALLALAGSAAAEGLAAGFQRFTISDGAAAPVEVGVWYPTDAAPSPQPLELFTQVVAPNGAVAGRGLPLVVMSHGNGGSLGGHYDTALALAHAGFVVAALTHTGDNYKDTSRAVDMANRPRQLRRLVHYMLTDWSGRRAIDPRRIGAFGFSSGGFTVLVAAGGTPDLSKIRSFCLDHPAFDDCRLVAATPHLFERVAQMRWVHDPRIKAVVAAAPAIGFTFAPDGLRNVTVPVDLWRPENDQHLPNPYYAEAVRAALPTPPTYHVVAHAGHYDVLAPCSEALAKVAPSICQSEPGFDRAAFHADFNRQVVAFFETHLQARSSPAP